MTSMAPSNPWGRWLVWGALALLGAFSLGVVALHQGETINALWIVVAAICVYLIAYRFYALFIAQRVLEIDPARRTPAVRRNDGLDYVPTDRYVLFGHHFAAIAGAGPLVGPVLAAQMGYLPGTLWLLVGVVFAGAVQDMIVLFISTRRDGRSLGEMIRTEMGSIPGVIAMVGILMIMIILLAVLALVVVKALAESPWGTFTVFRDHADRHLHGPLRALRPPGTDRRGFADRVRRADPRHRPRRDCRREPLLGARLHLLRRSPGADAHRLWFHRLGDSRLAAARAARLSLHLPEDRNHRRPRDRHPDRSSRAQDAGRSPVSSTAPAPFSAATSSHSCSSPSPAAPSPASIPSSPRERRRR
jgi:hypothetical protein